jgi:pimeloyl-ACP methyl ester carboxylesterase
MAKHIAGAKLVELTGTDHTPYVGDSDALIDEIEEFLTWRLSAGPPGCLSDLS